MFFSDNVSLQDQNAFPCISYSSEPAGCTDRLVLPFVVAMVAAVAMTTKALRTTPNVTTPKTSLNSVIRVNVLCGINQNGGGVRTVLFMV